MNTLIDLLNYGQSYWLDNLTRKKIKSGELKKRVSDYGLRGITSNPSIFNKAISNSTDYDKQIEELVKKCSTAKEIYEALTVKDVQDACDILNRVYKQSSGVDGYVSLEVSPYLARDTKGTIEQARRLFKLVNRKNCLIKIPGTKEGLPAIEQMLYEGIPVNITLLFSVDRYKEVAQCYIRAVDRRIKEKKPVKDITSVASFFLSRIDVLTDSILSQYINSDKNYKENAEIDALMGKAGIASAKLAYMEFQKLFNNSAKIKNGVRVQRVLWASTSSKNPLYSDLYYVESLIGKDTVNTLPDETIDALEDHGILKENTIGQQTEEAKKIFEKLKKTGIDIQQITKHLENEGIDKFKESYDELIINLANKRNTFLGKEYAVQEIYPAQLKKEIESTFKSLDEKKAGLRLFNMDSYLWGNNPELVNVVNNRLGWLDLPTNTNEILSVVKEIKNEGYKYAVLLGMGGSSLCSEVALQSFKVKKGYTELIVLDNTSPAALENLEKKIDIKKTIFIVASKSGSTLETISFFKYYYEKLKKVGNNNTGNNFIAITDDKTPLVKMADKYKFRKTFINPSNIGGRYSVLSNFGLLPMALMGIDINALLTNAKLMQKNCDAEIPSSSNPGISLGVALGVAQKNGRDKVTFLMSSSIKAFGFWVEQLLAESTGKHGHGLIPITNDELGKPEDYNNDRIFVHIYLESDENKNLKKIAALLKAGHPVINIKLNDKIALGGEYYRWEIATAIAGLVIGINPFDEPNVAEGKKNTNDLLSEWEKNNSFKKPELYLEENNIKVYIGEKTKALAGKKKLSLSQLIKRFYTSAKQDDYIAFLNYFPETESRTKTIQSFRMKIRNENKAATTLNYGPRYLHSTGQLHKGGPSTGMFIIIASDFEDNLQIPGQQFSFGVLHEAQSWGDFKSLDNKGRNIIYLQAGKEIDKALNYLKTIFANNK